MSTASADETRGSDAIPPIGRTRLGPQRSPVQLPAGGDILNPIFASDDAASMIRIGQLLLLEQKPKPHVDPAPKDGSLSPVTLLQVTLNSCKIV